MRRGLRSVVVACVAVAAGTAGPTAAAVAGPTTAARGVPGTANCAGPGAVVNPVPWPQQMLAPERVWPFSRGRNITVAVLDSGVDAGHPQLSGRVAGGVDVVSTGRADDDCLGTGTQVAGVIAAGPAASIGFAGLAPDASILPVRVVGDRGAQGTGVEPQVLARGIDAAVQRGADIIAVPVVSYTDSPALRAAVTGALSRGALVVAAVGDRAGDGNPTPYPAAYPGVIGVGAIGPAGERWQGSQYGDYVDLVAPGAEVVTLQRRRGLTSATGTGVACGFVAAAAALAWDKRGDATARDIGHILLATAVPASGGPLYGHGVVNPYAAVTDQVAMATPAPLPALSRPVVERPLAWIRSRNLALVGTGVAVATVLTVLIVAVALPRGRRRWWRAAVAPTPPRRVEPEEPGPPVLLFDELR